MLATVCIGRADDLLIQMEYTWPGEENAEQNREGCELEKPAAVVLEIFQRPLERCRPALDPGVHVH